jgi:hypothetical protein
MPAKCAPKAGLQPGRLVAFQGISLGIRDTLLLPEIDRSP